MYLERPFLKRFEAARKDGFTAVEIQFPYDTPLADVQRALNDAGQRCVLINVPAGDLMKGVRVWLLFPESRLSTLLRWSNVWLMPGR